MNTRKKIFLCTILGLLHNPVLADAPCSGHEEKTKESRVTASAGFFDNLFNRERSLRYQSERVFKESKELVDQIRKNPGCFVRCKPFAPTLHFHSEPRVREADHKDFSLCEDLLKKTQQEPILFEREFTLLEELNDWVSDLSQGDGEDGEKLYELCPGLCSPEYSYTIEFYPGRYNAHAEIICGHARDKDDDQYLLSSQLDIGCRRENSPDDQ